MPSVADARRSVELLDALESARDWRETFEKAAGKKDRLVEMQNIYTKASANAETLQGYDGSLQLPIDLAILMLSYLESDIRGRLRALGIEPPAEAA